MAAKKKNRQVEHFILAWDGKKMGKFFGAFVGLVMILLCRWPLTGAPRADAATSLLRLGWVFLGAYLIVGLTVIWTRRIILTDFVVQKNDREPSAEESEEAAASVAEGRVPAADSPALPT